MPARPRDRRRASAAVERAAWRRSDGHSSSMRKRLPNRIRPRPQQPPRCRSRRSRDRPAQLPEFPARASDQGRSAARARGPCADMGDAATRRPIGSRICATKRARASPATSSERPSDRVPKYLLQLQPDQKYAIVVDTATSTLYVFENRRRQAALLADYYISSGKNGIDKIARGRQEDAARRLSRHEQHAAREAHRFLRHAARSRSTIRTSGTAARAATATASGCTARRRTPTAGRRARATAAWCSPTRISMRSRRNVQIGLTPVIIADGIEWVDRGCRTDPAQGASRPASRTGAATGRASTPTATSSTTSPGFTSGKRISRTGRAEAAVNAGKTWIKVKLDSVSIFLYPGQGRSGRRDVRPGLLQQQSLQPDAQAPVLDQGRRRRGASSTRALTGMTSCQGHRLIIHVSDLFVSLSSLSQRSRRTRRSSSRPAPGPSSSSSTPTRRRRRSRTSSST